jgi:uncharacterized protein YbbC (DUF1343 family)
MARVRLGLDQLPERPELLRGRRVGLLCHGASFDSRLRHAVDVVAAVGRLAALCGPEHGLRGAAAAGDELGDAHDERTGAPVFSLYGERREPTPAQLDLIDVLVVDLQDVGARFFTYYVTAVHCLRACARAGKAVLVLDRPNPRGGEEIDGPRLRPEHSSFVGLPGLPIVPGLTIGEIARHVARQERLDVDLTVLELRGWRRSMRWAQTGLPWTPPSPNQPTLDTVALYPGTCLFEATRSSEGRGTTRPFEWIGAPGVSAERLAAGVADPGALYQPVWFTPTAGKHRGAVCGGVMVRVGDRPRFRALRAGLALMLAGRRLFPEAFAWRPLEQDGSYWIDRLSGSEGVRRAVEAGSTAGEIVASWRDEIAAFREARRPALLIRRSS